METVSVHDGLPSHVYWRWFVRNNRGVIEYRCTAAGCRTMARHTRAVVCTTTNQTSQLRINVHSYNNTYLHGLCMNVGLSWIMGIRHMCDHDEYGQSVGHEISRAIGQDTCDRYIESIQVIDTGSWCIGAVSGKKSRGMEVPRPLIYLSPK